MAKAPGHVQGEIPELQAIHRVEKGKIDKVIAVSVFLSGRIAVSIFYPQPRFLFQQFWPAAAPGCLRTWTIAASTTLISTVVLTHGPSGC